LFSCNLGLEMFRTKQLKEFRWANWLEECVPVCSITLRYEIFFVLPMFLRFFILPYSICVLEEKMCGCMPLQLGSRFFHLHNWSKNAAFAMLNPTQIWLVKISTVTRIVLEPIMPNLNMLNSVRPFRWLIIALCLDETRNIKTFNEHIRNLYFIGAKANPRGNTVEG